MEKQRNILYDAFAGNILLQDVCAKKKKFCTTIQFTLATNLFGWCLMMMMMMTILRYIDVVERAVC
jgi:hypothetical protein